MHINFSFFRRCKCFARRATCGATAPISPATSFDLREEYANAFRTESYNEFWARVLDLTLAHSGSSILRSTESTAAARLPSYRLFAEHLLDPDQPTVVKILADARTQCHPDCHLLLSDYYSETANASLLCSLLLKDIEQVRLHYKPLRATFSSVASERASSPRSIQAIDKCVAELSKALNPFESLSSSQRRFHEVQDGSADLLKRLESNRKKAKAKLRLLGRIKKASAILLAAITAVVMVVGVYISMHALVAIVITLPTILRPSRPSSSKRLVRMLAQLDAAMKGAFILNRDLDTISRLVTRLHDEVEHMVALLRFCLERIGDRPRPMTREVVRQLWKNDASFNQQLDELEEHLFLCFITINKARSLVMKEVRISRV